LLRPTTSPTPAIAAQLFVASISIFGSQNQQSRCKTDIPQTSVSSAYTTQPRLNILRTCESFFNSDLCPTAKAYLGQSRSAQIFLMCPMATLQRYHGPSSPSASLGILRPYSVCAIQSVPCCFDPLHVRFTSCWSPRIAHAM
jgi:hypothetical protein